MRAGQTAGEVPIAHVHANISAGNMQYHGGERFLPVQVCLMKQMACADDDE